MNLNFNRRVSLSFTTRVTENLVALVLYLSTSVSVLVTFCIAGTLIYEARSFFLQVSLFDFLTDTVWTPLFDNPHFGILPLVCGTFMTTLIAILLAVPLGLTLAIFLSEFVPKALRELLKPILELLGGVPTVIYGYFALLFVTPLLQKFIPSLPTFNMLSAGLVIGIMIIPYIATLSEDVMRMVPMELREGALALGSTRLHTTLHVVLPEASSGILSAVTLAFARAIGETMVVAIAAGLETTLTFDPRHGAATLTTYIVQVSLGDLPHGSLGYQSIFAAGLVLMLFTLIFNILGLKIRQHSRKGRA